MRTLEDVRQFFDTQLLPGQLSELEQRRKAILRRLGIVYAIIAALVILGILYFSRTSYEKGVVAAVVFGLGTTSIAHHFLTGKYRVRFKEVIIGPLVEFFNASLRYIRDECIPQPRFEQSQIFLHRIDRYNGDDFVSGTVGQTAVEFSELLAENKTSCVDAKGRVREHWHTIFKGLFFIGILISISAAGLLFCRTRPNT